MPYAVTLRLDADAAAHVRRLVAVLAADDLLHYAPHVTLAVYPDDSNIDRLRHTVETLVAQWRALPVGFAGLGLFPGAASVLWVAPVVTAELLRLHAALLAALPTAHPHYAPGTWVPHVTLVQQLADDRTAAAMAALVTVWQPFSGALDRVDFVQFMPVEVLASWPLD
jgi:2'-5' RNA ligase